MNTYPYTIENGAGEKMTFLGISRDEQGEDRLDAEMVAQPGSGPPMHVHYLQEEVVKVVSGKIGYQLLGEEPRYALEGETLVIAPGIAHRWWNAGTTEAHMTGWVKPPCNFEYFLTAIFRSTKEGGKERPSNFDGAFLVTRYGSEYGLLAMPSVVQKLLFPVVVVVGKAMGKYAKFKDAPEPVKL
jgi:quercetin dioxygenase-like cupin family protein